MMYDKVGKKEMGEEHKVERGRELGQKESRSTTRTAGLGGGEAREEGRLGRRVVIDECTRRMVEGEVAWGENDVGPY